MNYNSFKEDLTSDEINMLDDALNLSYEHPARTDFLHLARVLYHMFKERIYDDPDLDEEILNPLMDLMNALFLENLYAADPDSGTIEYTMDEEPDPLDFEDDTDFDDAQLDLDWDDDDSEKL